ncbi:protein phosphatase 2C domain-containing protein [Amycolatopsis sp. Hca4]|uniref:protein phosphatase 2C domain-containing protein n=1 Tax=Amycolatopsis sp. Hca4 TaxID=2742131 RepID=UPI0015916F4E|nr:protein phosphatase 2C domain-containing protein [Amycolatopsis sp. Hca4]QKV75298.1 protein phosphatase 2C domain-containing protein [Amycolatopsis sp. Hca4]
MSGGRHSLTTTPEEQGVSAAHEGDVPENVGDPGRAATAVIPLPDERFPHHPEIIASGVRIGESLDLRAASIRGLSHRYYGKVRQDHYAFRSTADSQWLVASVADGVSAAPWSHVAAELVTQRGCDELCAALTKTPPEKIDWHSVIGVLSDAVRDAVTRSGAEPEDASATMATTGLFAIIETRPDDTGRRMVHLASVGDSSAWLLRTEPSFTWSPLQAVKNDGAVVASSATDAIPVTGRHSLLTREFTLAPEEVLVLMTDGVGDPLGSGQGDVGRFLAERWAAPPHPLHFAAQVDFSRRTFDDDRTALAIWPVPDAGNP